MSRSGRLLDPLLFDVHGSTDRKHSPHDGHFLGGCGVPSYSARPGSLILLGGNGCLKCILDRRPVQGDDVFGAMREADAEHRSENARIQVGYLEILTKGLCKNGVWDP